VAFKVVIPARYASTRLPGKPLLDLGGKPMLQHVYERALESGAGSVVVATDDERIAGASRAFGATVWMTSARHRSGTERIAEVAARLGEPDGGIIVNVQGDEPLLPPALIAQVGENLQAQTEAVMATLCEPITSPAAVFDPDVVKVVFDARGYALYFSRAPIPWQRGRFGREPPGSLDPGAHFRHIGLYAYRAGYLRRYAAAPACTLESSEALEQLRALHHGARIHVAEACERPGPAVDTHEDLEAVRRMLGAQPS